MASDNPPSQMDFDWLTFFVGALSCLILLLWKTFTRSYKRMWRLDDPKTVTSVWSLTPDIIYQPMKLPLLYSILVGSGGVMLFAHLMNMSAIILGVGSEFTLYAVFIPIVAVPCCYLASKVSITFTKGRHDQKAAGTTCLVSLILLIAGIIHVYLTTGFPAAYTSIGVSHFDDQVGVTILGECFLCLILIPATCMTLNDWRLPPVAKKLTSAPTPSQLNRSALLAAIPGFSAELAYVIARTNYGHLTEYGPLLLISLACLLSMSVGTIMAISFVNQALLANEFQWHWRSFIVPAAPVAVIQVGAVVYGALENGFDGHPWRLLSALMRVLECGVCGSFGAYSALAVTQSYLGIETAIPESAQHPEPVSSDERVELGDFSELNELSRATALEKESH